MLEGKEARAQKLNELIESGKQKGMLSYKEIMDALEELELDQEQIEKVYDHLEELNIDIELLQRLPAHRHAFPNKTIELIPFVARISKGTPQAIEHQEIAWFAPQQLPDLEWCEADWPIVARFLENLSY